MSLEHQPVNLDLLTSEEAQQVIALYAEREKQRMQEVERISGMPTLNDIAALLSLPLDTVRQYLCEVQKGYIMPVEIDDSGDEHIPQAVADKIVALAGEKEKLRQSELEQMANMTSLKDVAAGLCITEDEANKLLKEVRTKPKTASDPKFAAEALAKKESEAKRLKVLLWLMTSLMALLAIAYSYYAKAGIYFTQAYQLAPNESYDRLAGTRLPQYAPSPSSGSFPRGWQVEVMASGISSSVGSPTSSYEDSPGSRQQLTDYIKNTLKDRAKYGDANTLNADPRSVPFEPIMNDSFPISIPGWAVVTVANGLTERKAYVNVQSIGSSDPKIAADLSRRLDYLVAGKASPQAAKPQAIYLKDHPLPAGLDLTVFCQGQCIRFMGAKRYQAGYDKKQLRKEMEASLDEAAKTLEHKGLHPKGLSMILSSQALVWAFDPDGLAGSPSGTSGRLGNANRDVQIRKVLQSFADMYSQP